MSKWEWADSYARFIFFSALYIGGIVLVGYHSSWWVALGLLLTLGAHSVFSQYLAANRYVDKEGMGTHWYDMVVNAGANEACERMGVYEAKHLDPRLDSIEEQLMNIRSDISDLEDVVQPHLYKK